MDVDPTCLQQWLEERRQERRGLEAATGQRARWAAEQTRARTLGLNRFLPPGMSLDTLARATRDTPHAAEELHRDRFEQRRNERAALLETYEAARIDRENSAPRRSGAPVYVRERCRAPLK
jgi:hypothetical protein